VVVVPLHMLPAAFDHLASAVCIIEEFFFKRL